MKTRAISIWFCVIFSALVAGSLAPVCLAREGGGGTAFKEAEFFIEFNASALDAGIQVVLDADDWRKLSISDPYGRPIFAVAGRKALKDLGLTELFFESVEPEIGDLPLADFLALFPEGEYGFSAVTIDRVRLSSFADFTHAIPCGPEVVPEEGAVLDPSSPVVVGWGEVTEVVDPAATDMAGEVVCADPGSLGFHEFEVEAYQVIVESDAGDLVADLTGTSRQLTVPAEFLEPGALYRFEVLAKEGSGNQTITEGYFCTWPLTSLGCEILAEEP